MVVAVATATLLSIVAGTWIGLRLLALARSSGKLPELAVGGSLFVYAAICQPATLLMSALAEPLGGVGRGSLFVLAMIAYTFTLLGLCVFTWQVFGPERRWRLALLVGIMIVDLFGTETMIEQELPLLLVAPLTRNLPVEALTNSTFAAVFTWMAVESLRYHVLLRRRQALGLAEPLVVNRVLVWGLGAAASAVLVAMLMALSLKGVGIGSRHPLASLVVTAAGLVNTVAWSLTFVPPAAYRRWVERRAQARASA